MCQQKRKMSICLAVIMASSVIASGCSKEVVIEEPEDILVETQLPQKNSISLESEYVGSIESDMEVTVFAKIGGEITGINCEVGDYVEAGDVLFTVDDTMAQIGMRQANASVDSAQASLNAAQAGEQAAQFAVLYTEAEIAETMGEVDTNQMRLENAVASAKYALKAAEEGRELSKEQYYLAADNYDDLEDLLDDLEDDGDQMKKYVSSLEKVQKNYRSIKNSSSPETVLAGFGLSLSDVGLSGDDADDANKIALAYISETVDADSEYELGVMVSSAKSSAESISSAKSSADDSKDSLRLNRFSAAISMETSKNAVEEAIDAKKLAEKMLADYENYTKATILAGANANRAGANSSLVSAQSGVVQAQAGLEQAQASRDSAETQLGYTMVKAPVSGTILFKNIELHDMAAVGSPAFTISANDSRNAVFYVTQNVAKALEQGQGVEIKRGEDVYEGQIAEVESVIDKGKGLIKVKVGLDQNDVNLQEGLDVKIRLTTARADNVWTIPVDCVYYENESAYVYCQEDGKAVKTTVETGMTDNEWVEIKAGLTGTSQVIVSWASQLKDGAAVYAEEYTTESLVEKIASEG